ncbi:MAG: hypothetical protein J6V48_02805 [Clostridia bacterium]|nr:hypothetical protein [Clostridia bacterium]
MGYLLLIPLVVITLIIIVLVDWIVGIHDRANEGKCSKCKKRHALVLISKIETDKRLSTRKEFRSIWLSNGYGEYEVHVPIIETYYDLTYRCKYCGNLQYYESKQTQDYFGG